MRAALCRRRPRRLVVDGDARPTRPGGRAQKHRDGTRRRGADLDLDLIAYDDVALQKAELTLPHPRLFERAFVLVPLAEIAPDRLINGVTVADALARLDARGIEKLPPR